MTLDPRDMTRPWSLDKMAEVVCDALDDGRSLPGDAEGGFFWRAALGGDSRPAEHGFFWRAALGGDSRPAERHIMLDTSHGKFLVVVHATTPEQIEARAKRAAKKK